MLVKQRVYVMAPYSEGDQIINVREAIRTADDVIKHGGIPFIPHLFHFWHLLEPRPKEFWMSVDKQMMHACHALISSCELSRASCGMNEELYYNELYLQLPVYTYRDLLKRDFVFVEVEG